MKPSVNAARLLDRFLRYVQVETTADATSEKYPSSPGQLELGRMLASELKQMGVPDAYQDEHGLVWGTVPATVSGPAPTILFNAHLDTSPDALGALVRPQVIDSYAGGDIPLLHGGHVIAVADCPALSNLIGHCLITTDGQTLLGGDDKAGVAAIMELAQHLLENPHVPHGPVRLLFTCDEEIGRGTRHVDLAKVNSGAGYTLDGSGSGEVENENFSADLLVVRAIGKNIHPSIAKGRMVNAVRGLSMLLSELPLDRMSPESTDQRDGFLHPYKIQGDVSQAEASMLLRDFDTTKLDEYERFVRSAADRIAGRVPGLKFELLRTRQYRNMADSLREHPLVVELALRAFDQLGLASKLGSIRGGTDGALLSEMGLPTPNLSVGEHNIHSVLEFTSLDEIVQAVEHAVELLGLWAQTYRIQNWRAGDSG